MREELRKFNPDYAISITRLRLPETSVFANRIAKLFRKDYDVLVDYVQAVVYIGRAKMSSKKLKKKK